MADSGPWEADDSEPVSDLGVTESSEETGDSAPSTSPQQVVGGMGLRAPPRFDTKSFGTVIEGLRRINWCVYPGCLATCLLGAARLARIDMQVL